MRSPIEIFRAGKHTDVRGVVVNLSAADLEASAKAYNPKLHEAPIVVGHPKNEDPAFGWIESLAAKDGSLSALPTQVDAAFAEHVGRGTWKKVSACFYTPTAAANPVPGVWYLKHVGFLGAAAPALKGLRAVSFAEAGEDDTATVEFAASAWGERNTATLFRSLRDYLLSKFGKEEAEQALPGYAVNDAQEMAAQAVVAASTPAFAEPATPSPAVVLPSAAETEEVRALVARETALAERERAVAAQETAFAEQNARVVAEERKAKRDAHGAFLDALVAQGRPLPCKKEAIVEFMAHFDGDDTVSFGEGESRDIATIFREEFLANLPKQVEFSELAPGRDVAVDLSPAEAAAQARLLMDANHASGGHMSASEAVGLVQQGKRV